VKRGARGGGGKCGHCAAGGGGGGGGGGGDGGGGHSDGAVGAVGETALWLQSKWRGVGGIGGRATKSTVLRPDRHRTRSVCR